MKGFFLVVPLIVWMAFLDSASAQSNGGISVVSKPASAAVYVDDVVRCKTTPCKVTKLSEGRHHIVVVKGTLVDETLIDVRAGKVHKYQAVLKRANPEIEISSNKKGVRVTIDGKDHGIAPVKVNLKSGFHKLVLDGRFVISRQERILVGRENRTLALVLQPSGIIQGKIEPCKSKITLDAEVINECDFSVKRVPGRYQIAVKHPDFPALLQPVVVRAGKISRLEIDLSKPGKTGSQKSLLFDRKHDAWFWSSVSIGAAAVIAASTSVGMFWTLKSDADRKYETYKASNSRDIQTESEILSLSGRMRKWEIAGWVMLGVGLVAGTSAGLAWHFSEKEKKAAAVKLTVYPLTAPTMAGLVATVVY